MTPQEKLSWEYMLFELTDEGGQPSACSLDADFGLGGGGYTSLRRPLPGPTIRASLRKVSTAADYLVTSRDVQQLRHGGRRGDCRKITVVFTPTALGPRSGTLIVSSAGK